MAYPHAVRQLFAILLLIAAIVHPIAHVDDPLVCACAHGAVVDGAPQAIAGPSVEPVAHIIVPPSFIPVAAATELPARAPPAA